MRSIEIRLKIVEPVEIPGFCDIVVIPRGLLDAGEDHALVRVSRFLFRPNIPISVFRLRIFVRFLEPWMLI